MATNNGQQHYDFEPTEADPTGVIPPDIAAGFYTFTVTEVTVDAKERQVGDSKKKLAQLKYVLEVSNAQAEDNKVYEGKKLTRGVPLFPASETGFYAKRIKREHQQMAAAMGEDLSLIPSTLSGSFHDFDDWRAAIKGKSAVGEVTTRLDNGEERYDINWAPSGGAGEAAEEPEPAAPPPKKAAGKTAGKSARR